jgi:Domain of unknown function (DUF4136)
MRRIGMACVVLALSSAVLLADDHSVIFDEEVDFSTFKTFAVHEGHMASERPELNFPAVMKTLDAAIRSALTASDLKEVTNRPDLVVEYSVTGVDYGIGPFGRANVLGAGRGGGRGPRASALPVDFTEATLVIDLKHGDPATLLWRGVYHDAENDAKKLGEALPKDAAKLLSEYPPKRKK